LELAIPLSGTEAIQVNPNPIVSNQHFTVRFNKCTEEDLKTAKLTIYNVAGNLILTKIGLDTSIELTLDAPAGIYIGTVVLGNGQSMAFEMMMSNL
jgi:hypothetical protein